MCWLGTLKPLNLLRSKSESASHIDVKLGSSPRSHSPVSKTLSFVRATWLRGRVAAVVLLVSPRVALECVVFLSDVIQPLLSVAVLATMKET